MCDKVFVNYIYDSAYTIEYRDYFLVFDYARGVLDIPENKNIIFFASAKGKDSYTEEIFNLGELDSLNYILNKSILDFKYDGNIIYLNKDKLKMKDLKKLYAKDNVHFMEPDSRMRLDFTDEEIIISAFSVDGFTLGYLIEIESLVIFYGGSFNLDKIDEDAYLDLLDELSDSKPDMIFLPITNLDKTSLAHLDKLISDADSQIFFPTKIGGVEEESAEFRKFYKSKTTDIRDIKKANQEIEIDIKGAYWPSINY